MNLKKFVATTLSVSILLSPALSSGSLIFATELGEDFSEDSFFNTMFQEVSFLDKRSLCLLNKEFYLEPITPAFLKHMVDIIRQLCSDKVKPGEIEDSGYVGNVLLRHSSYAKALFFLNAETVWDFNNKVKERESFVSFYDSLFYIYWIILRTYSSVCYKHSDKIINMDEMSKDTDSYWRILNGVNCIKGLLISLAIARAFTNKCAEYNAFYPLINDLSGIVVDFIKSLRASWLTESEFIEWLDINSLGIKSLDEKELTKLTSRFIQLFDSYKIVRTAGNAELNFKSSIVYPSFSDVINAERKVILLEKFFVYGCPVSVKGGKFIAVRPVVEIAASREVEKLAESTVERLGQIKKINTEAEKKVKSLEQIVANAEKSSKSREVDLAKQSAASSEIEIKKLAEEIEILANESKKSADLAVKKLEKLVNESERVTELNGAVNLVEVVADPVSARELAEKVKQAQELTTIAEQVEAISAAVAPVVLAERARELADTAAQETEKLVQAATRADSDIKRASASVDSAYTIVKEFENTVKKTKELVDRANKAAEEVEKRKASSQKEAEEKKLAEKERLADEKRLFEEKRIAYEKIKDDEKSRKVAEEKAQKQKRKEDHKHNPTKTTKQLLTEAIQKKLSDPKTVTEKVRVESETSSGSGSSSELELSPDVANECNRVETIRYENLKKMFKTEGKKNVELKIEGKQGDYRLVYSPLLFKNLKDKISNDKKYENRAADVMKKIVCLYEGGPNLLGETFGRQKVKSLDSCNQSKSDLCKKYDSKLKEIFGTEKGSKFSLYKFSINGKLRVAYFVNDTDKQVYVTDNVEHINK